MKKVLLIGDSISLDYGKILPELVRSDIILYSKDGVKEAYENLDIPVGGNGGDSGMVLDYIRKLESEEAISYDYFIFNCGLHDIKRCPKNNTIQTDLKEYTDNLNKIIELMTENSVKVIFINTTPTNESHYGEDFPFVRLNKDVEAYNAAAEKIMSKYGVYIIDLYSFTNSIGINPENLFRDHTHFNDVVIRMHAAYIAGEINALTR